MSQDWFYLQNELRQGPIPFEALKRLVQSGVVTPQTLVWREVLPQWFAAGTVPELNDLIGPPPAPTAPSAEPARPPTPPAQFSRSICAKISALTHLPEMV